ncbi:hypothetical protein [Rhizobium sp. SAFR-030]|uniref:hypothetical protein n=1 Tax=Rhizobium sp. SAFR-030 TaxID=3387277 RepID=UPI003F7FDC82
MVARHQAWVNVLRIVCATVFLSLGLAHHVPARPTMVLGDEYRLPDGSFAERCGEHADQPAHALPTFCEFCLLSASLLLPPPDDDRWRPRDRSVLANPLFHVDIRLSWLSIPMPRSRAPPSAA